MARGDDRVLAGVRGDAALGVDHRHLSDVGPCSSPAISSFERLRRAPARAHEREPETVHRKRR